jgi:hypothetical protein
LLGTTAHAVSGSFHEAALAAARGACLPFPLGERPVEVSAEQPTEEPAEELIRLATKAAKAPPRRPRPTPPPVAP